MTASLLDCSECGLLRVVVHPFDQLLSNCPECGDVHIDTLFPVDVLEWQHELYEPRPNG